MINFLNDLLIVIVKYNISLEESESFCSLNKIVEHKEKKLTLFVYDNSKDKEEIKTYKNLDITYIHNAKNPGVSMSYNEGAAYAKKLKKKWILLLDQDTTLPSLILEKYNEAIIKNPNIKLFVPILKLINNKIFSPAKYRFKRGFYLDSVTEGIYSLYNLAPVNSGIMVKVSAFLQVGGYNEKVKLDFSDFQFIERFRKTFDKFYVINSVCEQDFSDNILLYDTQVKRFKHFCEGALNIEKNNFWDWLQYNTIVFIRAFKLTYKYSKITFIKLYLKTFLLNSQPRN